MDLSEIVGEKMTRTEFIDLLIAEMKEEVEAKLNELEEGHVSPTFKLSDMGNQIKDVELHIRQYGSKTMQICFNHELPMDEMPAQIQSALLAETEHQKKVSALRGQLHLITARGPTVRSQALRMLLQETPSGRQLLEKIDSIRKGITVKLLTGKKKR